MFAWFSDHFSKNIERKEALSWALFWLVVLDFCKSSYTQPICWYFNTLHTSNQYKITKDTCHFTNDAALSKQGLMPYNNPIQPK